MACDVIRLPDGSTALVCGVRRRRCKSPGCGRKAAALCDWKLHELVDGKKVYTGKTCDAGMCDQHRGRVDATRDLCPPHYAAAKQRGWLPGAAAAR